MVNKDKKQSTSIYISTSEAADILGISRVAVHKRIKKGQLPARLIGHSYLIPRRAVGRFAMEELPAKIKEEVAKGVDKVLKEYGETLKLLGKE